MGVMNINKNINKKTGGQNFEHLAGLVWDSAETREQTFCQVQVGIYRPKIKSNWNIEFKKTKFYSRSENFV